MRHIVAEQGHCKHDWIHVQLDLVVIGEGIQTLSLEVVQA